MNKIEFPISVTDKLKLFPPVPDWAEHFYQIVEKEREEFRKWFLWIDRVNTIDESRLFLKDASRFWQGGQRRIAIMVYERQIIGSVAFVRIETQNKLAELGYWIIKEMRGKGFVTLSLEKLIEYGFRQLELNRIEIRCSPTNINSIAMAERLGFTKEGILRKAYMMREVYEDVLIFGLLKEEFDT